MLRLQTPLPERYTDATPDELATCGSPPPRRPSATGSSSSATTTSATRSCAGPTPGATRSACRAWPRSTREAEYIVFCGVHFMAESADILTGDHQQVILPDLNAGCSMADMADIESVEEAWEALAAVTDIDRVVPITYMNSSAALKAFVGRPRRRRVHVVQRPGRPHLGARSHGDKVLFFPDQHLGRNTGLAMGYARDDMRVWNPRLELGGLTEADGKDATFLLWKGHCSVHQRFRPRARRGVPGRASRRHRDRPPRVRPRGVRAGRPGRARPTSSSRRSRPRRPARPSRWPPRSTSCSGSTPRRRTRPSCRSTRSSARARRCSASTPPTCAWVLENLVEGNVVNRITVDRDTAEWAKVALERMLVMPPSTTNSAPVQ